jgi:magnesium transporter
VRRFPLDRRLQRFWRQRHRPGELPGTLTADPDAQRSRVQVIAYGASGVDASTDVITDATAITPFLGKQPVLWVNVEGLGDVKLVEAIGDLFKIDRLQLEDVVNTRQRPKMESADGYDFVIARRAIIDGQFNTEQVAIFFGPGFVVTFHESSSSYLEPVRDRIHKNRGKIRKAGSDYLMYAVLDTIIDHYFPVLTTFGEQSAELDDQVFTNNCDDVLTAVRDLRHSFMRLQAVAMPTREVLNRLITDPGSRIAGTTRPYLRDCQDHILQVIDQIDSLRFTSSDLMNHYHSQMTQKLNETMKVLTMIATIFIPLTFITSIYGMNFDPTASPWNMPELRWPWGYPVILAFMGAMTLGMLAWFYRMGWLHFGAARPRKQR